MARTETSRLDTYRKTLLVYYEEEIMGEAYFDALAEHFDGEGERDKLRLLTRHEADTIEFAARELARETDSTAPLRRYLEQCMVGIGPRRGGGGEAQARMSRGDIR